MADSTRTRLGRIRCLLQALDALQKVEPLPEALCFVPQKLQLECQPEESFFLYSAPNLESKTSTQIAQGKTLKVVVNGKPCFNEEGGWVQLISPHENLWILIQPAKAAVKVRCFQWNVDTCIYFNSRNNRPNGRSTTRKRTALPPGLMPLSKRTPYGLPNPLW